MATINGTAGADTLNGTTAADTINGAGGNDIIRGNGNTSGTDVLNGDAGDDTIYTGSGANNVHGGIGNDTLIGTNQTTFQDVLHGDDGNDIINGGGGRDFLYGEAGNDTIDTGADVPASNGISTVVSGGDGDDQIYSAGGVSDLRGDAGNDIFHANQGLWNGSEQYSGGADFDQIVADASNQNIGIASISGVERITGGASATSASKRKASRPAKAHSSISGALNWSTSHRSRAKAATTLSFLREAPELATPRSPATMLSMAAQATTLFMRAWETIRSTATREMTPWAEVPAATF